MATGCKSSALVVASLLLCVSSSYQSLCREGDLVRYVDFNNGNNSHSCLNSSTPKSNPCRTVNYALLEDQEEGNVIEDVCDNSITPDNLCIRLEDGEHRLTGEAQATNVTNLTIEAVNQHQATILCRVFPNNEREMWDNLVFLCSSNVTVEGVVFERCGPNTAGVFSHLTDDILLQNCIFRNLTGVALELREGTDYIIRNSTFEKNINQILSNQSLFVDLNIIRENDLNSLTLSNGALNIFSAETVNAVIEDCRFVGNAASDIGIQESRPPLLQLDGHGGAAYIRLTNLTGSSIEFRNSLFESNEARIDGGAVYVTLSGGAHDNSVEFNNCTFLNNSVRDTSGGAILVAFYNGSSANAIVVEDCYFEGNSAYGGGAIGVVVYGGAGNTSADPDSVLISSSRFVENHAVREGSAVGIFSFLDTDTSPFEVVVQNSLFQENQVDDLSGNDDRIGTAALSSFRFPVRFVGTNQFLRNKGGGLGIVDSQVTVDNHSHLIFEGNVAHFGGGVQLVGTSLFVVNEGVVVDFLRNKALFLGGAIMVNAQSVDHSIDFLNRFCFIRFSSPDLPPPEWTNVTVNFVDNTAEVAGAALYGTDLRRCAWLNITDAPANSTIFTPPENVTVPFVFSGNFVVEEMKPNQIFENQSLATGPVKTQVSFVGLKQHQVQPGETFEATAVNIDRFGNSRSGVGTVEFMGSVVRYAIGDGSSNVSLVVPGVDPSLPMGHQGNITLVFRLPLNLVEDSAYNFTLSVCHPGYVFEDGKCVCDAVSPDVLRCDRENRYVYVREGTYAFTNATGGLDVLSGVPPSLQSCARQGQLPGCLYKFDSKDQQCSEGRIGFFCGQCGNATGVTMDLQSCSSDCTLGVVLFVLWTLGTVVVVLILLVFNVKLPAELRAFIFYVQVIGLVFNPYSAIVPTDFQNLRFFFRLLTFGLPLPFCLSVGMPAFGMALLSFVTPLLALTIAVLYAICARFNSTVSSRGAIHGLSILGLFIYKYLADVALLIVSCRVVYNADGYISEFIFLYDGTHSCISEPGHLVAFIVSVLVIFTVILPAPFVLCALTARRWSKFDLYHFIDQITQDVRGRREWYAGWDIGRRLLFILVFFVGVYIDNYLQLLANFAVAAVVLVVHALSKPFKLWHNNAIEALVLLNLLLVTVCYLEPPQDTLTAVLVVVVTLTPYLYAVGYIVFSCGRNIKGRWNRKKEVKTVRQSKPRDRYSSAKYIRSSVTDSAGQQSTMLDSLVIDNPNNPDSPSASPSGGESGGWKHLENSPGNSGHDREDSEGNPHQLQKKPTAASLPDSMTKRDIDLFEVSEN